MTTEGKQRFTGAQIRALRFLLHNGGLEVPNMNMAGRSRDWPDRRTLNALSSKGAINFTQLTYTWRVDITEAGRAALAEGGAASGACSACDGTGKVDRRNPSRNGYCQICSGSGRRHRPQSRGGKHP